MVYHFCLNNTVQNNAGEKRWQRRRIIKREVGGGGLGLTGEILADLDSLANLGDPAAAAPPGPLSLPVTRGGGDPRWPARRRSGSGRPRQSGRRHSCSWFFLFLFLFRIFCLRRSTLVRLRTVQKITHFYYAHRDGFESGLKLADSQFRSLFGKLAQTQNCILTRESSFSAFLREN